MNIFDHSLLSAYKLGGSINDYLDIHNFIDSSKKFMYHFKHRALLHHTLGAHLAETKFGLLTPKGVPVRDVVMIHSQEDCDSVYPLAHQWLSHSSLPLVASTGTPLEEEVIKMSGREGLCLYQTDFGNYLNQELYGFKSDFKDKLNTYSKHINLKDKWQISVSKKDLKLLEQIKSDQRLLSSLTKGYTSPTQRTSLDCWSDITGVPV